MFTLELQFLYGKEAQDWSLLLLLLLRQLLSSRMVRKPRHTQRSSQIALNHLERGLRRSMRGKPGGWYYYYYYRRYLNTTAGPHSFKTQHHHLYYYEGGDQVWQTSSKNWNFYFEDNSSQPQSCIEFLPASAEPYFL